MRENRSYGSEGGGTERNSLPLYGHIAQDSNLFEVLDLELNSRFV